MKGRKRRERRERKKKGGRKVGKEERKEKKKKSPHEQFLNAFVKCVDEVLNCRGKGWVEVKEGILGIIGDGICLFVY